MAKGVVPAYTVQPSSRALSLAAFQAAGVKLRLRHRGAVFCSARVPLGDELRPIGNFVIGDAIAGTRQRDDDAIARDFDVEITSTHAPTLSARGQREPRPPTGPPSSFGARVGPGRPSL